jgi:hypothetical protein
MQDTETLLPIWLRAGLALAIFLALVVFAMMFSDVRMSRHDALSATTASLRH